MFSIFLAGFTLGVFVTLKIFTPEKQEESWDPQNLPNTIKHQPRLINPKITFAGKMSLRGSRSQSGDEAIPLEFSKVPTGLPRRSFFAPRNDKLV